MLGRALTNTDVQRAKFTIIVNAVIVEVLHDISRDTSHGNIFEDDVTSCAAAFTNIGAYAIKFI
jgi:hypothetical protein